MRCAQYLYVNILYMLLICGILVHVYDKLLDPWNTCLYYAGTLAELVVFIGGELRLLVEGRAM